VTYNGKTIQVLDLTESRHTFMLYNKQTAEQYANQLVSEAFEIEVEISNLKRQAAMKRKMAQEWQLAADQLLSDQVAP
jgi:hypothetical protein